MHPPSALAALVVLALSAPAAAGAGQPFEVTIVFDIPADHSAPALAEMKRETTFLLRDAGLSLAFKPLAAVKDTDEFSGLVVVRFRGTCRMANAALAPPKEGPLAFTHSTDGEVLPFAEVACDAVRMFIRFAADGRPTPSHDMLLGRALGRVLAHELYHIFARTGRHGSHGLARTALSAEQLIGDRLDFHPADLLRVIAAGVSD